MKSSEFIFDNVDLLHCKCHKISLDRDGLYIDSPKKYELNNNENKCFQYAVDVALNHEQIENHPERIFKTKTFINKNDWKEICFPSYKKDWKRFETNNKTSTFNILYVPYNSEKRRPVHISKHN